jgi:hypothetical protein
MSSQIICVLSGFFILSSTVMPSEAFAYGDYGSGGNSGSSSGGASSGASGIGETQQRRAAERFDIIGWIHSNNAQIAAQNSKYGYSKGGGSHAFTDIALFFTQDSGPVTRNSATLGKDNRSTGKIRVMWDDLFINSSQKKSLNIDLGFEGNLSQTTSFTVDPSSTQAGHTYSELGGGVILRPFGRSSQDTGLLVKGGYVNVNETGLWTNAQTPYSMYATYLGAEGKLYLLPFLGIEGDYSMTLEQEIDALQGRWKMQRFTYGAFLEIYLLKISAYLMSTEMDLTLLSGSAPIKEIYSGLGFAGTLYF